MDDWNIVEAVDAKDAVKWATEAFDKLVGFMENHKRELNDIFSGFEVLDGEQALEVAQTFATLVEENKDSINEKLRITE